MENSVDMKDRIGRGRFYSCATAVIVWCLLCAHCTLEGNTPMCMYTDPQFGFRICCPDSGWIITDETGISEVLVVLKSDTMVDSFIPNVTVAIEILSRMMTPEEYGERNREGLIAQGCEIQSWGTTVITRTMFYDLHCLSLHNSTPLRFRHLCVVKDRVGIIITCAVPNTYYPDFVHDFEYIVNSFKFLK